MILIIFIKKKQIMGYALVTKDGEIIAKVNTNDYILATKYFDW